MINPWLIFFISAAIIVFAGNKLTRNAAIIAENTGIGTAWAGALLLPLATSLPGMVTTFRSVVIDAPDMAVANVFGANFMNMFIVFPADLFYRSGPLLYAVSNVHLLSALLVILLVW